MIMRTYALYSRNRKVPVFLGLILVIGGSVSLWAISTTTLSLSRPDEGRARLYVEGCILVLSSSQ
ncbi:hypothetical protein C8Q76DRAFT_701278 [Earliella scabrosa]|nr:hypothetical protein C8Q76DRAFT_701278 [Earliella scabrosa]